MSSFFIVLIVGKLLSTSLEVSDPRSIGLRYSSISTISISLLTVMISNICSNDHTLTNKIDADFVHALTSEVAEQRRLLDIAAV